MYQKKVQATYNLKWREYLCNNLELQKVDKTKWLLVTYHSYLNFFTLTYHFIKYYLL
jgi:hypothetical protein